MIIKHQFKDSPSAFQMTSDMRCLLMPYKIVGVGFVRHAG